jgi:hypothetical protein
VTEPVLHESHISIGHEPGRTPERLVIVGLVLLVLLIIKPWAAPPQQATAPGPVASVAATPEPRVTATPVPGSSAALPCAGGMGMVEADTRWAGQNVRSWILTDAVQATGPTDPSIGFVVLAAEQVLAIGYCPSSFDDNRPYDQLTIYGLDPSPSTIVTTSVPASRGDAAANELFAPMTTPGPSGQAPSVGTWAAGRYVIRIDGPGGYQRWLGVEVRLISPGRASPAPSPAPSAER